MHRTILNLPKVSFLPKTIGSNEKFLFDSSVVKFMSTESNSYSSLYISPKYGHQIFSVLKPSYTVDYFQHLSNNLDQVQQLMNRRGLEADFSPNEFKCELNKFIASLLETNKLKKKRDKLLKKMQKKNERPSTEYIQLKGELDEARKRFFELEDKVMPIVLRIPNDICSDIKDSPEIIDDFSGFSNDNLKGHKAISYVRLGYINNIYQSSIVGPNAKYLIGEGAKFYYALIECLNDLFELERFVPMSGNDLVKSAIVEAVNSKEAASDNCMVQINSNQNQENQRLHLVGDASIDSLCALILNNVTEKMFFQVGSSYANDQSVEQQHCFRASILSKEAENKLEHLYRIWWNFLTQSIGIKCRSIRACVSSLQPNEYDRYDIVAWLHSAGEWVVVGNITHYQHYVSQRLGLNEYHSSHLVSSSVDLFQLFKCLAEHYQNPCTGQINWPESLVKYF